MCIAGLRRRRDLLGLLLDHRPLGDAEPAEGALLAVIADARLPARLFEKLANLLELHAAGVVDLALHLDLPLCELRPADPQAATRPRDDDSARAPPALHRSFPSDWAS